MALSVSSPAKGTEGESVVLLHGLGRGPWALKILEWRLSNMGYAVHNLGYNSRSNSLDEITEELVGQIRTCCSKPEQLHFVSHSLGGLVLRSLLAEHKIPNAGRAVLLAPPNQGSEIVDQLRRYPWFRSLLGPIAPKLGTRSQDLPKTLPQLEIPYGVIAGDRWINPLGAWLLEKPHDGTVRVEQTKLAGMDDHIVVPHNHTFIMNASIVAKQVHAFFSDGRFRPME